jgi:putative addiction module antidote protein, CC2985 family
MPTRNVVLTDRQAKFVEKMVASGRYQNASEVMREGLRLVEQQEAENAAKLKALREAVQLGIDDIEAGRGIPFDSFEAMEEHLRKSTAAALDRKRK